MPAHLKGSAVWKADRDVKAGEEVTLATNFEADQTDFENALRERIARAEAKGAAEAEAKLKAEQERKAAEQAANRGAKSTEEDPLRKQLAELQDKVQKAELAQKVQATLVGLGASDLEDVFRSQISVTPGMTDEELKGAVTKAVEARAAFVAKLKDGNSAGAPAPQAFGRPGSGGSQDQNAQGQMTTLLAKQQANRPELSGMLRNRTDQEKLEILKMWDGQKKLEPKQAPGK